VDTAKAKAMPSERENVCCCTVPQVARRLVDRQTCIIEHEGFVGNCLNIYVLEEAYYHYIEDDGPPGEEVPMAMHRCVREPSNV